MEDVAERKLRQRSVDDGGTVKERLQRERERVPVSCGSTEELKVMGRQQREVERDGWSTGGVAPGMATQPGLGEETNVQGRQLDRVAAPLTLHSKKLRSFFGVHSGTRSSSTVKYKSTHCPTYD